MPALGKLVTKGKSTDQNQRLIRPVTLTHQEDAWLDFLKTDRKPEKGLTIVLIK